MGFDKAEIIKLALEGQAAEMDKSSRAAEREMQEHSGAAQALMLMSRQMPSFAAEMEKRIEEDSELSSDTAQSVRVYVKNIIARFQIMCDDNSRNQRNSQLRSEGQLSTLRATADQLRKKGALELAVAKRRVEVEEEREQASAELQDVPVGKRKRAKKVK